MKVNELQTNKTRRKTPRAQSKVSRYTSAYKRPTRSAERKISLTFNRKVSCGDTLERVAGILINVKRLIIDLGTSQTCSVENKDVHMQISSIYLAKVVYNAGDRFESCFCLKIKL